MHYRVAKTIDASTITTLRDLVPTKVAAAVWNCLSKYKTAIPEFPQTETCELLIVDRSIDQVLGDHTCISETSTPVLHLIWCSLSCWFIISLVLQIAPIIHEWTYDAMCHDLLCMDGNKYVHEVSTKSDMLTF